MAKPRKDLPRRDGPPAWVTALKVLGILMLIVLIFLGAWAVSQIGPARVSSANPAYTTNSQGISKETSDLLEKSLVIEKDFLDAEKHRPLTPADLDNLREAIRLQNDFLDRVGYDTEGKGRKRSDELIVKLQNLESRPLREKSEALEQQSKDLEYKEDYAGAMDPIREAVALQDKINQSFPKSRQVDFLRSSLLQRHIQFLIAAPLDRESHTSETAARGALDRQDWVMALQQFQNAFDLQQRLNREFGDQRFFDPARLERLQAELVSLRSTDKYAKIATYLANAKAADSKADYLQAADLYQDALRLQRELNSDFSKSRFASVKAAEDIDTLLQTALSRATADEIRRQVTQLNDDLRHRRTQQAIDTITVLSQKIDHFHENFPRSAVLEPEIQQRLQYLNFVRPNLVNLQNQIYQQLLALPGEPSLLLLKNEVPQEMYQSVAGGNPSRNPGDRLPVETVSWAEANEFCQRLSWLLARPVRLPSAKEFRAAIGPTDSLDLLATTWNLDNSSGRIQTVASKKPNATGFYDLLGNVAEWLTPLPGTDSNYVPVIGGSSQTPVDSLRDVPSANLPDNDRSRFTGFRFLVDTDETAPLLPLKNPTPATPPPNSADAISSNQSSLARP